MNNPVNIEAEIAALLSVQYPTAQDRFERVTWARRVVQMSRQNPLLYRLYQAGVRCMTDYQKRCKIIEDLKRANGCE